MGGKRAEIEIERVEMTKRISKEFQTARRAFRGRVVKFLESIGAVGDVEPYRYHLETPLGELTITVYDHYIHCRFWKVERAKAYKQLDTDRLNPISGKWNWYFSDDPVTLGCENCETEWRMAMEGILSGFR